MKHSPINERLTLANDNADFVCQELRQALSTASPLKSHCLMPLIQQAAALADAIRALQFAINSKE